MVIGSVKGILIATYSRKVSRVEAKEEAGDFFMSNIGGYHGKLCKNHHH